MLAERLHRYLAGGTPPGATRSHPGCRDPRGPRGTAAVTLPGGVYFASRSTTWGGGGIAFYDPALPGESPGRAYLLTAQQFCDVVAQEMGRTPGPDGDLDLGPVLDGGRHPIGTGRYETLVHAGWRDGHPVLSFTAPWGAGDVEFTAPSAPYLRVIGRGLREGHGWAPDRIADHLCALPGARGTWRPGDVLALLRERRRG